MYRKIYLTWHPKMMLSVVLSGWWWSPYITGGAKSGILSSDHTLGWTPYTVSSIFKMLGPEKLKISQLFPLDYMVDFGLDFQEVEAMILSIYLSFLRCSPTTTCRCSSYIIFNAGTVGVKLQFCTVKWVFPIFFRNNKQLACYLTK